MGTRVPSRRGGSEPKLSAAQVSRPREWLATEAIGSDRETVLRGKHVRGSLAKEFDVDLSLSSVHRNLE